MYFRHHDHSCSIYDAGRLRTVNSPTIIVAEDHPMFRAALVLTVRRLMPDAQLMEVASHGELEKALVRSRDVRLVLLDLRMPGAHGLSSLVFLRGEYPDVAVAIISGGAYAETIGRARQLGASAFIPKSAPIDTIAEALSSVIRGELWFPEHVDAPTGRGQKTSAAIPKDSLKKILRAHSVVITAEDERGSPVTMQFAMPNPADVEASCNVD